MQAAYSPTARRARLLGQLWREARARLREHARLPPWLGSLGQALGVKADVPPPDSLTTSRAHPCTRPARSLILGLLLTLE